MLLHSCKTLELIKLHEDAIVLVEDKTLERSLFRQIARHGMRLIRTMLFANHEAITREQTARAAQRLDLDAFDVQLDDKRNRRVDQPGLG